MVTDNRQRLTVFIFCVCVVSSSGCRSGLSKYGWTASLFIVPMYKMPAGYSGTYHRWLRTAPSVVVRDASQRTIPANSEKTAVPSLRSLSKTTIEGSAKRSATGRRSDGWFSRLHSRL